MAKVKDLGGKAKAMGRIVNITGLMMELRITRSEVNRTEISNKILFEKKTETMELVTKTNQ